MIMPRAERAPARAIRAHARAYSEMQRLSAYVMRKRPRERRDAARQRMIYVTHTMSATSAYGQPLLRAASDMSACACDDETRFYARYGARWYGVDVERFAPARLMPFAAGVGGAPLMAPLMPRRVMRRHAAFTSAAMLCAALPRHADALRCFTRRAGARL